MNWKIRKTDYQIVISTKGIFRVIRNTYYFGVSINCEFLGGDFYDIPSAKTFINICKDGKVEIKYLDRWT